jgi:nicotinate-nucleotide adenylyltransferase
MSNKRKLGLFGGTFDPIHRGHLAMAHAALEKAELAEMIFLPAASPPHKGDESREPQAPFTHRLAMANIALENMDGFTVSDLEGRRPAPSYTVDTLDEFLAREGPDSELNFLIGGDWIPRLASWKDIGKIFTLCRFLVVPREGFTRSDLVSGSWELEKSWVEHLKEGWIDAPVVQVSSTDIRRRRASGLPLGDRLPSGVEAYIREHGLYSAIRSGNG